MGCGCGSTSTTQFEVKGNDGVVVIKDTRQEANLAAARSGGGTIREINKVPAQV